MKLNLFSIIGLLVFINCSVLAIIATLYGKQKLHKIWALFNIVTAIWCLGLFFIGKTSDIAISLFWWKFAHFGGIFIPVLFLNTMLELTGVKRKGILTFFYVQGIFFVFLVSINKIGWDLENIFDNFYYVTPNGYPYIIATILWFCAMFYGFLISFNSYLKSFGIRRNQFQYLLLGLITGFAGGASHFLPVYGIKFFPLNFLIIFYTIITTYAILRFRLMDINVAITRGAIFGLVYTLVLGIPFGLMGWGKPWLINIFGQGWIWWPMLTLLLFATAGPSIFMYLQRRALNRILAEEQHAHNLLLKASEGMTQVRNIKKLTGLIVHFISKTLKTTNAQVFLSTSDLSQYSLQASRFTPEGKITSIKTEQPLVQYLKKIKQPLVFEEVRLHSLVAEQIEYQMENLKSAVVVPCLVEDSLLGFLVLGDKKTGRMYTQADLNVLSTLANQAALAIENAQFYEEVKSTQEQLFQAEKMATIGTMADGLSHQINNRFNALGLIAADTADTLNMLDKNNLTYECQTTLSQIQNALKRIEDNVKSGGEIVKGLLKYSRPGQEGFEPVSLDTIIDSALEMAQYKVKLNEVEIRRNYDKNLPKLKVNLTQLQEVFFNLIDNAYFATKQRKEELKEENYKGRIDFSAKTLDGKCQIKVSDNGIGVKKEDFDKLFTPFFTTKATANKGTGLGLFVIHKIITNNHKGKISVESIYKQGTTFIIELPLFV
ncbi:MAG: ATP-binding protein [Candidatus Omnitrophota bacterium]